MDSVVGDRIKFLREGLNQSQEELASTLLHENDWPSDVIERQLAHVEGNAVRAAYNHAEYLPERRKMMQWWADYLDELAKK